MIVGKNKVVSLSYTLYANSQGETTKKQIESVSADEPLVFLFGSGQLLPDFEANLISKNQGDGFQFTLTPEQAYGEVDEESIVDLPFEAFMVDGAVDKSMLVLGHSLTMTDHEGHRFDGVIVEVEEMGVRMDFNHPMAGMTLHFQGLIENVREASQEEISHGHVHGPGGHHH